MSKETQRDAAIRIVSRIIDGHPPKNLRGSGWKFDLMALDDLLARSQYKPPEGHSDGTIDAGLWRDLMLLYKALSATIANLNGLQKTLKLEMKT